MVTNQVLKEPLKKINVVRNVDVVPVQSKEEEKADRSTNVGY